jgi:hypothetical protein
MPNKPLLYQDSQSHSSSIGIGLDQLQTAQNFENGFHEFISLESQCYVLFS